jgi:hypothetical protein
MLRILLHQLDDPVLLLSAGFSLLSGLIALGLLVFAVNAYRRSRDNSFAFLAGAFTLFAIKSFVVAFALWTNAITHPALEFVDAAGDLGTIFLILAPVFLRRSSE